MNDEAIIIACDEIVPEKIGKEKLNLYQLWHEDTYPDDYSLCKIAFCLARKCHELHLKGLMIANEWNEGNILISTTDCSVSITDVYAMNLSGISLRGTDGYLAPECYINHKYDLYSDYYGLAVFFYRMFIGGFPLDGKASEEYCTKNDLSVSLAAPDIYGSNALFSFDPNNQSNSIRNHVNELMPRLYEIQTQRWDATDERIKKCFIQTFSNGLQSDSKCETANCQRS
ncbi:hypothetical protein ACTNEW_16190 [Blautia sp. HCP3S3_G3]|uniref:hypothetical protein n=1 Tax=Blautia sp. HCP3S3_G3 TaxID=3438913 RepID=UPI003F8C5E64